jgi:hypothetical protein
MYAGNAYFLGHPVNFDFNLAPTDYGQVKL